VMLNTIAPHNETTATCLKQWQWIIERHFQLYKKFVLLVTFIGINEMWQITAV
jgi:hypothetical protein